MMISPIEVRLERLEEAFKAMKAQNTKHHKAHNKKAMREQREQQKHMALDREMDGFISLEYTNYETEEPEDYLSR
jgi:hypothetical protein